MTQKLFLTVVVLGKQALTNLWDRYELMGSQLREAITPLVIPTARPVTPLLSDSLRTFSRRQGLQNRYRCARTEGMVVVRSEVSITTANAPPNTPRGGTSTSALRTILPLPPRMVSVPSGGRVGQGTSDGRGSISSITTRRSRTSSQRDDDLDSLVSGGSEMSSSICEQVECDLVVDHTDVNERGSDRLNQTLADVDPVCHQGWFDLLVMQW